MLTWHKQRVLNGTCSRYDLCWHQVFVIVGLAFYTLEPTVEFLI